MVTVFTVYLEGPVYLKGLVYLEAPVYLKGPAYLEGLKKGSLSCLVR